MENLSGKVRKLEVDVVLVRADTTAFTDFDSLGEVRCVSVLALKEQVKIY